MRGALIAAIVTFAIFASVLEAQEKPDSTGIPVLPSAIDTLKISASTAIGDTASVSSGGHLFTRHEIDWSDYNSLGYIVKDLPGLRLYELGEYGHPGSLSLAGSTPSQFSIVRGSESINDLLTGMPDHNFVPTEELDSVFVPEAHQAFYYGGNGRQLAVVAHEKDYDSPRPFSRIRHTEGPSGYLYSDVIFSVNTAPQSNFTAGLTRQSVGTSGNSALTAMDAGLENSGYESWNLRGSYSTRFSQILRLKVEDHYDHFIDMFNGGVDPRSGSIRNPDSAFGLTPELVNPTMRGEVVRNRVGARLQAAILGDTARPVEVEAAFLTSVRYFRDLLDRIDTAYAHLDEKTSWSVLSLTLRKSFSISSVVLDAGANFDRYTIRSSPRIPLESGWNSALFARGILSLPLGSIEGAARAENTFSRSTLGYGITVRAPLGSGFDLWAGGGRSERAPTLNETYLNGSKEERGNERLAIAEAGVGYRSGGRSIRFGVFLRDVAQPQSFLISTPLPRPVIESAPIPDVGSAKDWGATAEGNISFWVFSIAGRIGAYHAGQLSAGSTGWELIRDKWNLSGSGEFFYHGEILKGALELKTGVKAEFAASEYAPGFEPRRSMFGYSVDRLESDGTASRLGGTLAASSISSARIDLFLFARVRTAIIHLILENLADARSITTYFYPMPGRSFRFGVSWVFLD